MIRFEDVRLRAGLGWVDPVADSVALPRRGDAFEVAPGARSTAIPFQVVDTPVPVALFGRAPGDAALPDRGLPVVASLRARGIAAVVWVEHEGPGAAVCSVWSGRDSDDETVAAALCALKTQGGWDETPSMAFCFADACVPRPRIPQVRWLSARAERAARGRAVEAWPLRREAARVLRERDEGTAARGIGAVLADVDGMKRFNDRHGQEMGTVAIARVHGCLEGLARDERGTFLRWGGDELLVAVEDARDLEALAGLVERAVADLAIPLGDGTGRPLRVSTGIIPFRGGARGDDFGARVRSAEDGLRAEKRRRRGD